MVLLGTDGRLFFIDAAIAIAVATLHVAQLSHRSAKAEAFLGEASHSNERALEEKARGIPEDNIACEGIAQQPSGKQ